MNYYPNYKVGTDGTNQEPKISWLIPNYNESILKSIDRALEDLANEDYFTYEEVFGER